MEYNQSPGALPKTSRHGGTRHPLSIRSSYPLDVPSLDAREPTLTYSVDSAQGLSDIGTVDQGTFWEIELPVCHDRTQTLIAVWMIRR